MDTTILVNIIAFIVFILCILIYGWKLRSGMKKPGLARRGLLNVFYRQWVHRMSVGENTYLAIQTMRNLIMSVTFLSSSLLILLGFLAQSSVLAGEEFLNLNLPLSTMLQQYKLFVLFFILVFSLLMFLLSLRHMVRFNILIGIPNEVIEKSGTEEIKKETSVQYQLDASLFQSSVFLKAMNRFTYGIRGVYFAITVLVWFISAYTFIIASILVTIILIRYHDIRPPKEDATLI
jgi:uncharacterized membrane protein